MSLAIVLGMAWWFGWTARGASNGIFRRLRERVERRRRPA